MSSDNGKHLLYHLHSDEIDRHHKLNHKEMIVATSNVFMHFKIYYILYYMQKICNWISSWWKKTLTEEEIEQKINDKMNKWLVDQYANNRYLDNIPESRKREKRKEFRQELIKENQ